jgi:hypothetical protein
VGNEILGRAGFEYEFTMRNKDFIKDELGEGSGGESMAVGFSSARKKKSSSVQYLFSNIFPNYKTRERRKF